MSVDKRIEKSWRESALSQGRQLAEDTHLSENAKTHPVVLRVEGDALDRNNQIRLRVDGRHNLAVGASTNLFNNSVSSRYS